METQNRILVACGGLMLTSAFAATQGTLGATSQGSFTNTFNGTTAPQVQILGLSDSIVTPATGEIPQREGAANPQSLYGSADYFCVVNTGGGAVTLNVTADQYGAGQMPAATAAGGSVLTYVLSMHIVGNHTVGRSFTSADPGWTIPAGAAATSAAACGSGNVRKAAFHHAIDGAGLKGAPLPANGNVYIGTVTITATPE